MGGAGRCVPAYAALFWRGCAEFQFRDCEVRRFCHEPGASDKTREKKTHTASGLEITTSVYECGECDGCPLKEKCIRACGSKKPLEERHKVIYVSKRFARQRQAMEAKISSPKGCLLRVNRSIQAEGNFAYVKQVSISGASCYAEM